jgi:hypothetical protein
MRWGWEQGLHKAPPPHTHSHTPGTSEPDCLGLMLRPVAPPPLPVYSVRVYSRRSGGGPQPLPCVAGSQDVCWVLSMDSLSYGRCSYCAQGPESLCTSMPICFPSSPCGGGVRVSVAAAVFFFCKHFCLTGAYQLI